MIGACMRIAVGIAVGMSTLVVAIPASLVLAWVAMGCMWALGLLSVMKVLVRLLRRGKSKPKKGMKKRSTREAERKEQEVDESVEIRSSLFEQYLEDQLNTLAHQLLHVCRTDSLPNQMDLPLADMDCSDWTAITQVDDQDRLQNQEM